VQDARNTTNQNSRFDGAYPVPNNKISIASDSNQKTLIRAKPRASRQLGAQILRNHTNLHLKYNTPYDAQVTALWRRYAGERDMQQILEIDRKSGAATDPTVIIYYVLCRHADPSIYGMSDSTAPAHWNDRLGSRLLRSVPRCLGSP